MSNSLERHLEQAQARLNDLRRAVGRGSVQPAWTQAVWEELSANLEELHVASAELRQQSEEIAATRLLVEEERRNYQDLFDLAPDAYFVTDPVGLIQRANAAAAGLLGVRVDFLTGKPLANFVVTEARAAFRTQLQGLAEARATVEWSSRLQPREGAPLAVIARVAPVRDQAGVVTGLRWSLHDITAHAQAEAEVGEAQRFAQSTIDALSAHVCVLDEHGQILATNKAWDHMAVESGASGSGLRAPINYLEVCDKVAGTEAADAAAFAAGARAVIDRKTDFFSMEYPCHSNTEQRWFATRVTRFGGPGAVRVVVAHENITARRLAELALARSARALKTTNACNRALVRAESEPELLEEICRAIVAEGGYRMAWVGFAEHDAPKSIRVVASAGAEPDYLKNIRVTWNEDEPRGCGPGGLAVRSAAPVICQDVKTDPRFAVWQEEAVKRGYGAVIALPLKKGAAALGVLCIYAAESGAFREPEIELLAALADDVAYGIENLRSRAQRRAAEAALRASEASLVHAQKIGQMGNWDWNIVTDELVWSAQIFELFGLLPDSAAGTYDRFLQGVHPEDRERAHQAVLDAVAGRAPYDLEHRVLWPDGTVRVMHERGEVTRDAAGRPVHMTGTVQDITERKRAEGRFARLFYSGLQGAIFWNRDGAITGANDAFLRMVGYTREDLVAGRINWREMTPPEEAPGDQRALAEMAATGVCTPFEKHYIRKDGSRVPILIGAANFPDAPDEGVCFVLDISASKQAAQEILRLNAGLEERVAERTAQLEQANRELAMANQHKSEFLASMSHELRTPLNAIVGFTGTLLMKLPGPLNADQEKQLRTVQTSGKHLLSLINDLLDLARIEAGKQEINPQPVAGREALERVATTLRGLAEQKGLALEIVAPAAEVMVHTDQRALNQILLNLVGNAIKFTEQGRIGLELRRGRDAAGAGVVEFLVSDTGPGIAREQQAWIFGVFAQGHASHRPQVEGSGLGLYVSQKLAALLGGHIALSSQLGEGSVFTVSLPENGTEEA